VPGGEIPWIALQLHCCAGIVREREKSPAQWPDFLKHKFYFFAQKSLGGLTRQGRASEVMQRCVGRDGLPSLPQ
ncbi:MAG: hypothetical protein WB495_13980, partial [Xanthobacteraceae bacterium]